MADLLLALWTAAGAIGSGSFLLRRAGARFPAAPHRFLFAAGVGLALLSSAALLLAAARLLAPPAVFLLLAGQSALLAAEARPLLAGARAALRAFPRRDPAVLAALVLGVLLALFALAAALAPPDESDALTYHLPMARAYAETHRLADLTGSIRYAVFPQGMELLFALGFSLGDGPVFASLLGAFCGALLALAAGALARELAGSVRAAAVAAVLVYSYPSVGVRSARPDVDGALAFFLLLALLAALRLDREERPLWAVLLALFGGFAFSLKYTGALSLLLPALFILSRRFSRSSLRILPPVAALFALFAAPWLFRNALYTGNPVSPFLNGIFHGSNLDPFTESTLREHLGALSGGALRDLPAFLRDFFLLHSPAPLLLLPLPFLFPRRPGRPLLLSLGWGALLLGISALLLPAQWRFFLAPLAIAAAASFAALPLLGPGRSVLRGAVLAFLLLQAAVPNGAIGARQLRKIPSLFGEEARRAYLLRRLDNHAAAEYAARELPAGARILSLADDRRFYFGREVVVAEKSPAGSFAYTAADGEEVVRRMREAGFTHLFLNRNRYWEEHRRPSVLREEETLRRRFVPLVEEKKTALYELRPEGTRP